MTKPVPEKDKVKSGWVYDERDLSDRLKIQLSGHMVVRLFYVTSGDSGEKYDTYLAYVKMRSGKIPPVVEGACSCPDGKYYRLPIARWGGRPQEVCKHVTQLAEFLRKSEEGS